MLKEWLEMAEGILQALHQDHQELSDLIEQIQSKRAVDERNTLFKQMMNMLLVHSHTEQNVLYKKLEKSQDEKARKFAFSASNEHQIVEQQLQQLSRARNKGSEQWLAQLSVLGEPVNHHVKEEESTGFACARHEFDREQLEKLGGQFRRQKEKLMAED